MIERIHSHVAETVFGRVTVPALPDRGRAVDHAVAPPGVSAVGEDLVAKFALADLAQHGKQELHAEKAGREVVVRFVNLTDEVTFNLVLGRYPERIRE